MAIFELKPVSLGNHPAQGYAFKRKTAFGQVRRGIAYLNEEEGIDTLQEKESFTFSGPCYYEQRGPREREFDAFIEDITETRMGTRIDFVEVDYPEMLLDT
ncbi:MAG: hypothetical protein ACOCSK_02255 [Rhodothermales bacterium]